MPNLTTLTNPLFGEQLESMREIEPIQRKAAEQN